MTLCCSYAVMWQSRGWASTGVAVAWPFQDTLRWHVCKCRITSYYEGEVPHGLVSVIRLLYRASTSYSVAELCADSNQITGATGNLNNCNLTEKVREFEDNTKIFLLRLNTHITLHRFSHSSDWCISIYLEASWSILEFKIKVWTKFGCTVWVCNDWPKVKLCLSELYVKVLQWHLKVSEPKYIYVLKYDIKHDQLFKF